ncbi:MAG TPA: fasciclin domain-containing protein [Candidatus Eisenbacteria bacterium]|nr:fasciclin domain-containing protein [Candidatus Eisenbacteria bacterium]
MRSIVTRFSAPTAIAVAAALVLGSLFVAPAFAAGKPDKNIVQVAREAGQFSTLLAALEAADLVGTLSGQGKGPFTVFAPTDAAFAKLPPGTVESLLKDPVALKNVLLYHVAAGDLRATDVLSRSSITMANGQTTTISGAKINDSSITATDIAARNGVIHVIDTVLIPR